MSFYKYLVYFILSFLVTIIFVVLITDGYGFRFKNYYPLSYPGQAVCPSPKGPSGPG